MKKISRLFVSISTFCVLFTMISGAAAIDKTQLDKAVSSGIDYYKNVQKAEYESDVSKKGTPFHAMLRSETAMLSQTEYMFLLPMYDIKDVSAFTTCEDYAKMIVALVASGSDPKSAVEGYDVEEKLSSMQQSDGFFAYSGTASQSFTYSGHFWSMLSLDLINYDYNRTKALSAVIDSELSGGGFAEVGQNSPSLDVTALATLVLARYTNPAAVEVRNRCVEVLKQAYVDGMFSPFNENEEPNVITQSLCVMALISSGEQIWNEPYTTESYDPINYILSCQDSNGGFWYSPEYKKSASDSHKAAEDYASAVSLCAILDVKNMRSYILNIGEKFTDTTHTEVVSEPMVSGFEFKYVLIVGGVLIVILVIIFIIGLFRSDTKNKKE